MADILGALALLAVALLCIIVGAQAFRDIAQGKAETLSRMSTRVYDRRDEPLNFWMTVGAEILWLFLGLFLLAITLGGMLGLT